MINLTYSFILILVLSTAPWPLFAQFSLTIEIDGLQNNNGQVLLELSNDKGEQISGVTQAVVNKKCVIIVKSLKPGNYSFKYFHDENKNRTLDTNFIGMPTEGFGFSNNAKGRFGPPPREKTMFAVTGNTTLKCTALYL